MGQRQLLATRHAHLQQAWHMHEWPATIQKRPACPCSLYVMPEVLLCMRVALNAPSRGACSPCVPDRPCT